MTRTVDTLTDDEVAAYIETRRHKPRAATARDIHSQRMAWVVEEIRAEERERCITKCAEIEDQYGPKTNGAIAARECIAAIREQEAGHHVES